MRNILVHDYERVDPEKVWAAVQCDLPALRQTVEEALRTLGGEED